jgi:hypothetical protein
MRKNIPIDEKKTRFYDIPALVAIHMLGGSAHINDIHVRVGELVAQELNESDHRLMCHTEHGEDYAPHGYQGEIWEVWNGKLSTGLGTRLKKQGLVTRKNNVFTLTPAGISRLGHLYAHLAWDYPLN